MTTNEKNPSLLQSILPIIFLILTLSGSVYLFADDSSYGPNQIALIFTTAIVVIIGLRNGIRWKELEGAMVKGISLSMPAVLILLVVGSLIGTWILAGIVPTMIYYGIFVLQPSIFFAGSCLLCALVSLATGSSWTTAGTIGIAIIGIGTALNMPLGITAGVIISGSYFGDKMSPLSDTTNLAPAMAGTDLFTHIRHMAWTTVPSFIISLVIFALIGFFYKPDQATDLSAYIRDLESSFRLGWYLMIPPIIVLIMVVKKIPAMPALFIGALLGAIFAVLFQQDVIAKFVGEGTHGGVVNSLKAGWRSFFAGFTSDTGNKPLDDLLTRGGMSSMLNTVWLIITAMIFGGTLERAGILTKLMATISGMARSTGSLIFSTLATTLGTNILAADQYIAIVLPGRMFKAEFQKRNLHPKNLSRCLEDSGTLTSALIPWNTCGAYMAATLGVGTLVYLPFCFFNYLNPLISATYGFTGFTIEKMDAQKADSPENSG